MADDLKQMLLDAIQSSFPIEERAYAVLAQRFNAEEGAVREAIRALYDEGSIRRIGASFDSRKLGYTSTLCALAVPGGPDELAQAAEVVSSYPGVTHNYGRTHRYNLWFTLITRSAEEKAAILAQIRERTGCDDLLDMPATRKFKISVDFGRQRAASNKQHAKQDAPAEAPIDVPAFDGDDPFDVEVVRWAQGDIARDAQGNLLDDPYAAGAEAISAALGSRAVSADEMIERLVQLKSLKVARRFGAMVRHHQIGFSHNAMTVWDIPDDEAEKAGKLFATAAYVSHCYTRPRAETWPANLYAMVHAQSADELAQHVEELAGMLEDAGVTCNNRFALETTNEFKKVSMTYFAQ